MQKIPYGAGATDPRPVTDGRTSPGILAAGAVRPKMRRTKKRRRKISPGLPRGLGPADSGARGHNIS